jgi:hypothetical protein
MPVAPAPDRHKVIVVPLQHLGMAATAFLRERFDHSISGVSLLLLPPPPATEEGECHDERNTQPQAQAET